MKQDEDSGVMIRPTLNEHEEDLQLSDGQYVVVMVGPLEGAAGTVVAVRGARVVLAMEPYEGVFLEIHQQAVSPGF